MLSGTVPDNLLLGLPDAAPIDWAVHTAIPDRDLGGFPDGRETAVGVRGVKLSGGQVQRVAIARALVRTPELLFVDDVASALDAEPERRFRDCVFGLGTTCLVTSYRRAVLERADPVLVLDDGRVVARDRQDELVTAGRIPPAGR